VLRRIVPWFLALVCVAGALALLWRSETDLFPCKRDDFIYGAGRGGYGMGMRDPETVSCRLSYFTSEELKQYNAKLERSGWALLILLGGLVPGVLGYGAGQLLTRRAQPSAKSPKS
jgi:hypothetical protein